MPKKSAYKSKRTSVQLIEKSTATGQAVEQQVVSQAEGFVNRNATPPTDDLSGNSSYVGKGNPLYGGL